MEILGEKGLVIHADGGGWGVKKDVVTTTTTVTMTWLVGWFPTLHSGLRAAISQRLGCPGCPFGFMMYMTLLSEKKNLRVGTPAV